MRTEKELEKLVRKVNYEKNVLIFNLGRNDAYVGKPMNERYRELSAYCRGYEEGQEWSGVTQTIYNNLN